MSDLIVIGPIYRQGDVPYDNRIEILYEIAFTGDITGANSVDVTAIVSPIIPGYQSRWNSDPFTVPPPLSTLNFTDGTETATFSVIYTTSDAMTATPNPSFQITASTEPSIAVDIGATVVNTPDRIVLTVGSPTLSVTGATVPGIAVHPTTFFEYFIPFTVPELTGFIDGIGPGGPGDGARVVTSNLTTLENFAPTLISKPTFNDDISTWDTSNVTSLDGTFSQASIFNQDITAWDVSNVTTLQGTFSQAENFNQPIGTWNLSPLLTNTSFTFDQAYDFNQDLSSWPMQNVTTTEAMFRVATSFNQDLSAWNTSSVTDMTQMFFGATVFNGDVTNWDVSNVTIFSGVFSRAENFNRDISGWDVSSGIFMNVMFGSAFVFNQDISSWDTSSVIDMTEMFASAYNFNQPIGIWNTSNVTSIAGMFAGAQVFNQPIGNWDVSSVLNMNGTFNRAYSFNQDISGWNTSSVTTMLRMFEQTNAFTGDIREWDVSSVTNMDYMFQNNNIFNQDLSRWCPAIDAEPIDFDTGAVSWENTPDWHPTWGQFKPTLITSNLAFIPSSGIFEIIIEFPAHRTVNSFGDFTDADVGGSPVILAPEQGTLSAGVISPTNIVTVTYTAPATGSGEITLFIPYGQSVDIIPDPDILSGKLGYPIRILYGTSPFEFFPANYTIMSCILSAQKSRSEYLYTPSSIETYGDVEQSLLYAIKDAIRTRYLPDFLLPFEENSNLTLVFYFYDPTGAMNPQPSATILADWLLSNQVSVPTAIERNLRKYIDKIFGSSRNFIASFFDGSKSSRNYTSSFGCGSLKLTKTIDETEEC